MEKLLILGPRKRDEDEDMESWKNETEKLYFKHIFPYLQWNDLLRFRRICKDAKELADKYIKVKGEKLCPEITIYETSTNKDKCLARFLELGFSATKIYILNTSGTAMFEKEAKLFAKFAEKLGPGSKITQVRIHQLNNPTMGNEKAFFEGLSNLRCLHVDQIGGGAKFVGEANRLASQLTEIWPRRFNQLKKVTIGNRPDITIVDAIIMSRSLMELSPEIEYSADLFSSATAFDLANNTTHITLSVVFTWMKNYIEKRGKEYPTKPNLKFYDFDCYHKCPATQIKEVEFFNSPTFIELVDICVKHSVKLLNVNAAWLQSWMRTFDDDTSTTGISKDLNGCRKRLSLPIVSMVNLHGLAFPMTMPNLEKLTITATSRCSLVPVIWLEDRQPWPALKILDVTVDSKMLYSTVIAHDVSVGKSTCLDPESTASLMLFLFVGIQRPAVTEMSLGFVEGVEVDDGTMKAVSRLGVCCPNLKKLTLVNWPGTNVTLIKVLVDIKALEELCLDNCKKIGNLAFTKTDTTDGLIHQHPGLKKLALKQLDKMPKVTDKLFQDVISRMKFSHLLLSSNSPLTNITPEGIPALKNGEFAKSIEKFPFSSWSLANVSKEKFREMEKEFRSYDMI